MSVGETLARLGAKVSDTARPPFDAKRAHDTYVSLLNSVMASRQPEDEYAQSQARAAELDPRDMSFRAVSARGMVLSHRDWLRYNFKREHLRFAWDEFFNDWDILLCPEMAIPAFPHDHRPFGQRTIDVDGTQRDYFEQLFWSGLITNAYLPSTVFSDGALSRRPAHRDSGSRRGLSRSSHHRVRAVDGGGTGRIPGADTAGQVGWVTYSISGAESQLISLRRSRLLCSPHEIKDPRVVETKRHSLAPSSASPLSRCSESRSDHIYSPLGQSACGCVRHDEEALTFMVTAACCSSFKSVRRTSRASEVEPPWLPG